VQLAEQGGDPRGAAPVAQLPEAGVGVLPLLAGAGEVVVQVGQAAEQRRGSRVVGGGDGVEQHGDGLVDPPLREQRLRIRHGDRGYGGVPCR